jgi:HAD superfamily hydrolase (TIGR01490 family)
MKKTIAAFDFDGTLTRRDSLIPYLNFLKGSLLKDYIELLPVLIKYAAGFADRQDVKETLLKGAFRSLSLAEVQKKADEFANTHLDLLLKPEAMKRFHWHKERGDKCLLISANLDLYLNPWGRRHGFEVISSRVNPDLSGHLIGKNCRGEEKVKRLLQEEGSKDTFELWAYGDSRGDKELLELADHPFFNSFTHERPYDG